VRAFQDYIQRLQEIDIEQATEHTHRSALENLLRAIALTSNKKITIQQEPKREDQFGAPDFKVKCVESIIGYIENKKLGEDLNKVLKSAQIKKYLAVSNNILITNYTEWIWIDEKAEPRDRAKLCELSDIEGRMPIHLNAENVNKVKGLILNFLSQPPKGLSRPKALAEALAVRGRFLRDFLHTELDRQQNFQKEGRLFGLYETFRTNVFAELNTKTFSDAFSQTLVYGLFISRLNAGSQVINLYNAKGYILPAFGLIRELVDFLDELYKPEYQPAKWILEEILSVMNNLNLETITRHLSYQRFDNIDLFQQTNVHFKDPFVYFYEDFIEAYDIDLKSSRGVYYTPPQVVDFIVRSTNQLLKTVFEIEDGYANRERVTVLDFAVGTGTFIVAILEQIFLSLPKNSGKKNLLIREHILKNIYGFEYLIAPYTIANLKLSQFLKGHNYILHDEDRFQIYLTNTLEPINRQMNIPLLPTLAQEARAAQEVKDKPILVITGNPPYKGESKNPSERKVPINRNGKTVYRKVKTWIGQLLTEYFFVDGVRMKEKNPKWLNDDYVKFIRFAQSKMDEVEQGVVAIITNHRYLSNPTFRGMRRSLMNSFDQIYIMDLHGSNKPKEKVPGGGVDENIFPIEQGVAITFFIKKPGLEKKIYHSDLYGKKDYKFNYCLNHSLFDIPKVELTPQPPFYLFRPQVSDFKDEYDGGVPIKEMFKVQGNGIITKRDELSIHFEKEGALQAARDILHLDRAQFYEKYRLKPDVRDWRYDWARQDIENFGISDELIQKINYRPFDIMSIVYTGRARGFIGWPVVQVMRHFLNGPNVGLVVGRAGQNVSSEGGWNLAFVTEHMTDYNLFSRGGGFVSPLYLYIPKHFTDGAEADDKKLFERVTNFTDTFVSFLREKYGQIAPEEVFGYIYAMLYSPLYRSTYSAFLSIDFPKIPFTDDIELLHNLSALGWNIINAHTLNYVPAFTEIPYGSFVGQGDFVVKKREFQPCVGNEGFGRLYINDSQYFDNIPIGIWKFYLGGYQTLDKFLKDRMNCVMSLKDVDTLEKMVRVISYTKQKMIEIDRIVSNII
jgi:hypothetical protein